MAIVIFQHASNCGPGRLGLCLRDHGFKVDLRRLDLPKEDSYHRGRSIGIPADFDNVHGVISLGGPQNVGDDVPWMKPEMAFLAEAHRRQLPVMGICLGHQMVAQALGGAVGPMVTPEVGFHRVSLTTAGQIETVLGGVAWDGPQLQSHGQEVKTLPAGATLLATSKGCKNQAFKAGVRTYGFQYHFECDRTMCESFLGGDDSLVRWCRTAGGDLGQSIDEAFPLFNRMADRLCVNLAAFMFPEAIRLSA